MESLKVVAAQKASARLTCNGTRLAAARSLQSYIDAGEVDVEDLATDDAGVVVWLIDLTVADA